MGSGGEFAYEVPKSSAQKEPCANPVGALGENLDDFGDGQWKRV